MFEGYMFIVVKSNITGWNLITLQINHQSTEGLTAREAMKLLDSASQPVVLDVGRQTSPVSSAGSSPTPTIASVLSPLTGHLTPTQVNAYQHTSWRNLCLHSLLQTNVLLLLFSPWRKECHVYILLGDKQKMYSGYWKVIYKLHLHLVKYSN